MYTEINDQGNTSLPGTLHKMQKINYAVRELNIYFQLAIIVQF